MPRLILRLDGSDFIQREVGAGDDPAAGGDDVRIVEVSVLLEKLAERLLHSQAGTVRPVTGERLDHVTDCDDSRRQQNVATLQPLRVPGSVEPLMVLAYRVCDGAMENRSSSGCCTRPPDVP